MKIKFWKLKEDERLAAAFFPSACFWRDDFWITGSFSKKIFCFVEGIFWRRNVIFSCKKTHYDFFRNLGDVFEQISQNSIIRFRRNNLKKPNFSQIFFPLNFSRFSTRSLDFWRNVLVLMAATFPLILTKLPSRWSDKNCGFSKLFSKHERASAKRGQYWQTIGKKTHLLRGWFSVIYSGWRKLRRQLPSSSTFWKNGFQKKECNMFL